MEETKKNKYGTVENVDSISREDLEYKEHSTIIERLLNNKKIFREILSMPDEVNEDMVKSRRNELFSMFWENTDLSKETVIENVKNREEDFIEKYEEIDLPEWLLRAEGQDVLLEFIHRKYEEEGILVE